MTVSNHHQFADREEKSPEALSPTSEVWAKAKASGDQESSGRGAWIAEHDQRTVMMLMSCVLLWVVLYRFQTGPWLDRSRLQPRVAWHSIEVNRASREQWQSLPGIGPGLAERIVRHRELEGGFNSPSQLQDVPGIGPKTWARIQPWVRVDSTGRHQDE